MKKSKSFGWVTQQGKVGLKETPA